LSLLRLAAGLPLLCLAAALPTTCSGSCAWPLLYPLPLVDHPSPLPRDLWCNATKIRLIRIMYTRSNMSRSHARSVIRSFHTPTERLAAGCGVTYRAWSRLTGRCAAIEPQNPYWRQQVRVPRHRRAGVGNTLGPAARLRTITTITTTQDHHHHHHQNYFVTVHPFFALTRWERLYFSQNFCGGASRRDPSS